MIIYVNPFPQSTINYSVVYLQIMNTNLGNSESGVHSKIGDLIYSSCNMTITNVNIVIYRVLSGLPAISYQVILYPIRLQIYLLTLLHDTNN